MPENNLSRGGDREWLLVRGLARSQGHWLGFCGSMRAKFPNEKIHCIDLPGNGEFYQIKSPLEIAKYSDWLRSHCPRPQGPLHVIAMSLGAMAVVDWMDRFPCEINRSYLINTSSSNLVPIYDRLRPRMAWHLLKVARQKDLVQRELMILEMVSNADPQVKRAGARALAAISKSHPLLPKNVIRQLWAAAHSRFPQSCPGSVVLVASERDHMVSVKASQNLANLWKCPIIYNKWAGHDIPFDDADWLVQQISDFESKNIQR